MKEDGILSLYKKVLLVLLALMIVVFSALYFIQFRRVGLRYQNTILLPSEANGSTLYSGKIDGQDACFTVTPDKTVTFRCGEKTYGPYTAKEDPTAIPDVSYTHTFASVTGVEVRDGDAVIFRGGLFKATESDYNWLMVNEDGTAGSTAASTSNGTVYRDGKVVDPMEPTVGFLLHLMEGPELTRKGGLAFWFFGTVLAVVTIIGIFFGERYYGLRFIFHIQDWESVEPTAFALLKMRISLLAGTVLTFIVYYLGVAPLF